MLTVLRRYRWRKLITNQKFVKAVGPGMAFQQAFGDEAEIVATVICGDTYFNENIESASAEVISMIKQRNPDVIIVVLHLTPVVAVACGAVIKLYPKS